MKRTFKNFDEYSEYYENREHKMNDVDVVENTVTVCADGEFECKNWKTAVRRFFKEINDNSLFDGWKECITECVENGIWKEKEEYNGEHVCGGWFWEVECIDEGCWYVSLTVSKEIEEESEAAETAEEAEQEETEVKTKMYWAAVRNKETNQLEVIKRDDYSSKKDFAHDLRANGYAVRFISTPDKFDEDCENYYWECEKRKNVRKCVSESKERMETAEQETTVEQEMEVKEETTNPENVGGITRATPENRSKKPITYYIISCSNIEEAEVVRTAESMKYARCMVYDEIALDVCTYGHSNGYKIVSEKLMKEYHGFHDDCKKRYVVKYMKGLKNKPYICKAIEDYKARHMTA